MLKELSVVKIHRGSSPVMLTVPHSGNGVPTEFYDKNGLPLGFPKDYFTEAARNHEACDWGTEKLVAYINKHAPWITTVSTDISRLVVENNRRESAAIVTHSPESGAPIPANNLTADQRQNRLEKYYYPFQDGEHRELIYLEELNGWSETTQLHTCVRQFKGQIREKNVGSFLYEKSSLSKAGKQFLKSRFNTESQKDFKSNWPYDLRDESLSHTNIGPQFMEKTGHNYFGIEIVNDLLLTDEGVAEMGDMIIEMLVHLEQELAPQLRSKIALPADTHIITAAAPQIITEIPQTLAALAPPNPNYA